MSTPSSKSSGASASLLTANRKSGPLSDEYIMFTRRTRRNKRFANQVRDRAEAHDRFAGIEGFLHGGRVVGTLPSPTSRSHRRLAHWAMSAGQSNAGKSGSADSATFLSGVSEYGAIGVDLLCSAMCLSVEPIGRQRDRGRKSADVDVAREELAGLNVERDVVVGGRLHLHRLSCRSTRLSSRIE